jgi:hypothetical protein
MEGTSRPSNSTMMSPASSPAFSAGPPSVTPATSAPMARSMPRLSAISSVTSWMRTPSQPRRVSPNSVSCWMTGMATSVGTAKPMPIDMPVSEMIAVLMPMTSPFMLNSGPPELPRLMEASVWMNLS